jgi:glycosyltransferase involved in cell wall biosynthesis
MMDVTVVMPTWNRPQFLPAAIESVFAQTVPIRELIIADDGSDAPTRAVLETYAQMPRVRVLWRSHCGNPGAVRNGAIREASGRYIAFADSDDVWCAGKLERQFAVLLARPECRWSYTSASFIDAHGRPIAPPGDISPRPNFGPLIDLVAKFDAGVALPSVLVERALLFEAGLFDESLGCYEDYDLWLRMASLSEAAAIGDALVKLRQHDEHYSRRDPKDALNAREDFLKRAIRLVQTPAVRTQLRRMRALDSARLADLAALAGDAGDTALRLRSSIVDGWSMPRWWFIAARAHSRLWNLRARRKWEQWW